MKLKFALSVLCFGFLFVSPGQEKKINLSVKVGYAGLHPTVKGGGVSAESTYADGVEFGVSLLAGFSNKLFLEPGVVYTNIENEDWLFVPLHLKYYTLEKFSILLGPQVTFGFADTEGLPINKTGLDLSFGLSYDITKKFFVEIRYALELTNRTDEPIDLSQYEEFEPYVDILGELDLKTRMNSVHVTLGYKML